jgi:Fur family peroxide stress response transcriptional regulator
MNSKASDIREKLIRHNLKITPQRLAVLEAVIKLNNHPTADQIIAYVHKNHPNIASGTIYKILDVFTERKIIRKVKTDRDIMRYDSLMEEHHHLYCTDSDRIEDYFDHELNQILDDYFAKKAIPDFEIEDIKLQIIGKFVKKKSDQV